MEINDINEQYLAEFLTALQSAINQMSADGQRISYVPSKSLELSKYMDTALDDSWRELRGMEIVSVAVASISYTDDSVKLINMRNEGAMLGDLAYVKATCKVPLHVVWKQPEKMKQEQ